MHSCELLEVTGNNVVLGKRPIGIALHRVVPQLCEVLVRTTEGAVQAVRNWQMQPARVGGVEFGLVDQLERGSLVFVQQLVGRGRRHPRQGQLGAAGRKSFTVLFPPAVPLRQKRVAAESADFDALKTTCGGLYPLVAKLIEGMPTGVGGDESAFDTRLGESLHG